MTPLTQVESPGAAQTPFETTLPLESVTFSLQSSARRLELGETNVTTEPEIVAA